MYKASKNLMPQRPNDLIDLLQEYSEMNFSCRSRSAVPCFALSRQENFVRRTAVFESGTFLYPTYARGLMTHFDWWEQERIALAESYRCVTGIDEAGRGPLAGAVVAACVVLPFERVPEGVQDSKTLTANQRERLFDEIMGIARGVGIGRVDSVRIDEINILQASHEAMRLALADLPAGLLPDIALIDGLPVRPFPIDQVALVKGDSRSPSIAAASIIAKVTRDRLMIDLDLLYPQYDFASNKGYGSPSHLKALEVHGICPIHRRSYKPVQAALHRKQSE